MEAEILPAAVLGMLLLGACALDVIAGPLPVLASKTMRRRRHAWWAAIVVAGLVLLLLL